MTRAQYRQAIQDFPDQFALGLETGHGAVLRTQAYEQVLVCGMGGSSLGAELLQAWLELSTSLVIYRDYDLPKTVPKKTLVIAISYSGTTEETLAAAKSALKQQLPLVVITTGGPLSELARRNKFPVVSLPKGLLPRLSVGAQIGALYSVLVKAGVVPADEEAVIEAAAEIAQTKDIEKIGQRLAKKIGMRIPLIYGSSRNLAVLRSWKIKFNETAKAQAFWQALPEADHNAINALPDGGSRFCLVTLVDQQDHPRVQKRLELTAKIAVSQGLTHLPESLVGSSRLSRLLFGLWLGDWVALALADMRQVDPAATPIIEQLKQDLART